MVIQGDGVTVGHTVEQLIAALETRGIIKVAENAQLQRSTIIALARKVKSNLAETFEEAINVLEELIRNASKHPPKLDEELNQSKFVAETIARIGKSTGLIKIHNRSSNLSILATCFIFSAHGHALTAAHLFKDNGDQDITVTFLNDDKAESHPVKLLRLDEGLDLALIKLFAGRSYVPLDLTFQHIFPGQPISIVGHAQDGSERTRHELRIVSGEVVSVIYDFAENIPVYRRISWVLW